MKKLGMKFYSQLPSEFDNDECPVDCKNLWLGLTNPHKCDIIIIEKGSDFKWKK
jgi:hypothetical protein